MATHIDYRWRGIISSVWANVPVSRYHLWKSTPTALVSLCGRARRVEGQSLFYPEPDTAYQTFLCATCSRVGMVSYRP